MVFTTKDETELHSGINLRRDKPHIYVPQSVERIFEAIATVTKDEFSFFYKVEVDGWDFTIDPKGFMPKQRVSGAHIEYDESRPSRDYRCVIHRHPNGCNGFSSDDNDFINLNFDISLIWTMTEGFVRAQLNWLNDGERLIFDCDVTTEYALPNVSTYFKKIKPLYTPEKKKEIPQSTQRAQVIDYQKGYFDMVGNFIPYHTNGSETIQEAIKEAQKEIKQLEQRNSDNIDMPPTLKHDYSDAVANVVTVDALLEEDSLIDEIITYFKAPQEFPLVMAWVGIAYEKRLEEYDDFENLMYGFIRTNLIMFPENDKKLLKNVVNRMSLMWSKGEYEKVVTNVIALERLLLDTEEGKRLKAEHTKQIESEIIN